MSFAFFLLLILLCMFVVPLSSFVPFSLTAACVSYNKRQMSRIYPKGNRVDSSNYMPQVSHLLSPPPPPHLFLLLLIIADLLERWMPNGFTQLPDA